MSSFQIVSNQTEAYCAKLTASRHLAHHRLKSSAAGNLPAGRQRAVQLSISRSESSPNAQRQCTHAAACGKAEVPFGISRAIQHRCHFDRQDQPRRTWIWCSGSDPARFAKSLNQATL